MMVHFLKGNGNQQGSVHATLVYILRLLEFELILLNSSTLFKINICEADSLQRSVGFLYAYLRAP